MQADTLLAAKEDRLVQRVQRLGLVQLAADRPPLALVGEVVKDEGALRDPPVLAQRQRDRMARTRRLQARDEQAGGHLALSE